MNQTNMTAEHKNIIGKIIGRLEGAKEELKDIQDATDDEDVAEAMDEAACCIDDALAILQDTI